MKYGGRRGFSGPSAGGAGSGSLLPCSPAKCLLTVLLTVVAALLFLHYHYHTSSQSTILKNPTLRAISPTPLSLTAAPVVQTLHSHANKDPHASPQQQQQKHQQSPTRLKVAIAITVTKDGPFVDGALVLGYAARKYHHPMNTSSLYDVDLVAFVTSKVTTSRVILSYFGWRILEKPLPVALDEIQNQDYAQRMRDSGCCGADEFLKLWAYTLTEYHKVRPLDPQQLLRFLN